MQPQPDRPPSPEPPEASGAPAPRGPGGCGLTGCLYGAVALFGLLLAGLVVFLLTRVWTTPVVGMP